MAAPTDINFDDFYEAVKSLAAQKGFICKPYKGKKASAICFEFFRDGENKPFEIFCVHEDKKNRVIWSDDLKKACKALGVTKKEFIDFTKNKV
ncbi:MAG: hypothetical protein UY26_C0003G0067 [Candidatus Jorgensenbacteria bacterium GW2011_GWA1_48_13]|uniref:Uncharacterized protein n=1 Tax=Candidatus Jorgensenbacteria bacterium GW2011_GWB1_50_10 TaxID=1618665 RepID=A0A0G1W8I4_9BACT|nr:MAG: hypothetical protein UY26_C0003G0067 [Candidatus Jorgensenbacteria bacterium GW2011_GWA1_48_13]KKW15028.1 MAG: hypothetical protein UY55_C0002G0084 [Candidatus Jorgensenbacteria bacterium GW2011_GWB1_50_10]